MLFKLWSELDNDAYKNLKPDFGYRNWKILSRDEKNLIWKYLEGHFFNSAIKESWDPEFGQTIEYYEFPGPNSEMREEVVTISIERIMQLYKTKNFARNFFTSRTSVAACFDFYNIFINEEQDAVYELISLYSKALISVREKNFFYTESDYNSQSEFLLAKEKWQWEDFDLFAIDLNSIFGDFGIDLYLTRNGFIPKQEKLIIKEIYEPVIKSLGDPKWKKVNELLSDSFLKYRENTSHGYSTCVTHTVAAVEAFLQIVVKGKTGEGEFAGLISEGQKKGLIPNDMFTRDIFKTLISILMKERKETGDAHVKKLYATEKNAKMVLNLAVIFIQHCILI